jgi:hypothetical protein
MLIQQYRDHIVTEYSHKLHDVLEEHTEEAIALVILVHSAEELV